MIATLFSPFGHSERQQLAAILGGSFAVALALRLGLPRLPSVTPAQILGASAVVGAILAWVQVCVVLRRVTSRGLHAGLGIAAAPISVWLLWSALDIDRIPAQPGVLLVVGILGLALLAALLSPSPSSAMASSSSVPSEAPSLSATCSNGHAYDANAAGSDMCARERLAGWLVEIDGEQRGEDFCLLSRVNRIGADPSMNVRLRGAQVAPRDHASIEYHASSSTFLLKAGAGETLVNGLTVTTEQLLQPYDRVTLGATTFVFMPFAGLHHVWDDVRQAPPTPAAYVRVEVPEVVAHSEALAAEMALRAGRSGFVSALIILAATTWLALQSGNVPTSAADNVGAGAPPSGPVTPPPSAPPIAPAPIPPKKPVAVSDPPTSAPKGPPSPVTLPEPPPRRPEPTQPVPPAPKPTPPRPPSYDLRVSVLGQPVVSGSSYREDSPQLAHGHNLLVTVFYTDVDPSRTEIAIAWFVNNHAVSYFPEHRPMSANNAWSREYDNAKVVSGEHRVVLKVNGNETSSVTFTVLPVGGVPPP